MKHILIITVFGFFCCSFIANASLIFSTAQSTITPNQDAIFCVDGGLPPYSWKVEGANTSISASGNCATITADECFCKKVDVIATDSNGASVISRVVGSQGIWELIESKSNASEITSVSLPLEMDEGSITLIAYVGDDIRVLQTWRFNGGLSSSGGCSSFPSGSSSWASNIAVYPSSEPSIFGVNYTEPSYTAVYPYHPWDDVGDGTYAAIDNRNICGNDGYGRNIRVGTPTNLVQVHKLNCNVHENCYLNRGKNFGDQCVRY